MFLIPFDATGSECSTLGRSRVLCPADEETEARGRRDPAGVPRCRDPRAWMGGQVPPGPRTSFPAHGTQHAALTLCSWSPATKKQAGPGPTPSCKNSRQNVATSVRRYLFCRETLKVCRDVGTRVSITSLSAGAKNEKREKIEKQQIFTNRKRNKYILAYLHIAVKKKKMQHSR